MDGDTLQEIVNGMEANNLIKHSHLLTGMCKVAGKPTPTKQLNREMRVCRIHWIRVALTHNCEGARTFEEEERQR